MDRPLHAETWKRRTTVCVLPVITFGVLCCLSTRRRAGELTWETLIGVVLLSAGHPVAGGGGAPVVTVAVCAEVTVFGPVASVPVTATRIVWPASPLAITYVLFVAPVIEVQLAPAASHCRHWYVNVIDEPVQVPGFAVRVEPTVA